MRIVGHGVDLVDVGRIAALLGDHGERFLERCFTPGEREYGSDSRRRAEHLAARFAAKEAVLKALGTGWRDRIAWTDIEVISEPSGRPSLRVSGRAGEIAGELGITDWLVSLTHTDDLALASVIGVGP